MESSQAGSAQETDHFPAGLAKKVYDLSNHPVCEMFLTLIQDNYLLKFTSP